MAGLTREDDSIAVGSTREGKGEVDNGKRARHLYVDLCWGSLIVINQLPLAALTSVDRLIQSTIMPCTIDRSHNDDSGHTKYAHSCKEVYAVVVVGSARFDF